MTRVLINGKEYEAVCDICVLQELQEEFGTVNEFERKLVGIKGFQENDKGEYVPIRTEPNIKACLKSAVLMINEANEINGRRERITLKDFLGMKLSADSIAPIAEKLHEEFTTCFKAKNE